MASAVARSLGRIPWSPTSVVLGGAGADAIGRFVGPFDHWHVTVLQDGHRPVSVQLLDQNGGRMGAVPTNVGVFLGRVDKRSKGWYWADTRCEKLKGAIQGPFESKEQAIENALQNLWDAASDQPAERGAA
jgi:hypothetical protein